MNTDNDWTTVRSCTRSMPTSSVWGGRSTGSRQMPSAFSGGGGPRDDDRATQRREYDRMNAEAEATIKAREARESKAKRDAATAKERDALALDSESSYPSLGGGPSTAAAPSKFATNFRDKVAAMAAREKEAEELRALADAAAAASAYLSDWAPTGLSAAAAAHRRRTLIGTRCFDDGVEDYDGPEEDFGDDNLSDISDHEENEPPANEEHNAHLGDIRRRNKNSLY
jgi:hypothetical protein